MCQQIYRFRAIARCSGDGPLFAEDELALLKSVWRDSVLPRNDPFARARRQRVCIHLISDAPAERAHYHRAELVQRKPRIHAITHPPGSQWNTTNRDYVTRLLLVCRYKDGHAGTRSRAVHAPRFGPRTRGRGKRDGRARGVSGAYALRDLIFCVQREPGQPSVALQRHGRVDGNFCLVANRGLICTHRVRSSRFTL